MARLSYTPVLNKSAYCRWLRAFTLIEVLVVVAIIALLAAILVPALRRAREQARIIVCRANAKQVGSVTGTYKSEFDGHVPVLYNYHNAGNIDANDENDNPIGAPARCTLLSVAFHAYDKSTANLNKMQCQTDPSTNFNPNTHWNNAKLLEYERRHLMPEIYVCPFAEDAEPIIRDSTPAGSITIVIGDITTTIELREWKGWREHFHTSMWDGSVKGRPIWGGRRTVERTGTTWNRITNGGATFPGTPPDPIPDPPSPVPIPVGARNMKIASNAHRRWGVAEARRLRVASPSDLVTTWCAKGEYTGWKTKIFNSQSHRTSRGGGTNALFADSHVEWVKGDGIGCP